MKITIEKRPLKLGQPVYIERVHNFTRNNSNTLHTTISTVGTKYFQVTDLPRERFRVDTLRHDGGRYSSKYKVYLSLQEIEDEKEANKINQELIGYFSHGVSKLPLEKLKKIKEIING